jgi:hypothetical protein
MTEVFSCVCLSMQFPCFYLDVKCYFVLNPYLLTMYDYLIIVFDAVRPLQLNWDP